jgi:hypothetical protein
MKRLLLLISIFTMITFGTIIGTSAPGDDDYFEFNADNCTFFSLGIMQNEEAEFTFQMSANSYRGTKIDKFILAKKNFVVSKDNGPLDGDLWIQTKQKNFEVIAQLPEGQKFVLTRCGTSYVFTTSDARKKIQWDCVSGFKKKAKIR